MAFYKRECPESRGDEFDHWGSSIWYFETRENGMPIKQIEIYSNGKVLKYDEANPEDKYGFLGDQELDLDEFKEFTISKDEFESIWNK
ncbi:hypothetical protein [Robiginitalea sediminis]|uniref:hypothetical protein n=1 Tax=Robiginitalea sediminis TaxID=1982593 RepID=UPI000B4A8C19|nr:hypothetical protein [Robiginitalea sediminis]